MEKREKWLDLVVYEVYLRSFADGNGDGIGDLRGLREKLDYLQELGVNAVWITPCYESPDVDNGYDISNYFTIDRKYGTLAEWKELVADMHARGMKIIMDLVVNHTSDKHEWFVQGRTSKNNPYHDYYLWANEPKNTWRSTFGGSAWEYNEPTGEYYLHLFAKEQPDLNWENAQVRKEVQKIVDFWVKNGVDGFRCDVLDHISKDFEKGTFTEG
ncbi:MAG: glucohydrolase, partial [Clostridia bacterium]|nr:glucohydrolase [Clostridia bacterium]